MNKQKFDLHETLAFVVNSTGRTLNNKLSRAFAKAGFDITVEQWEILVVLWKRDGQCQHELATFCSKDRPSVTRILDNMEKRELVTRTSSKEDRRNKHINLTAKGKELHDPLMKIANHFGKSFVKGIDEKEIEAAKALLKKIQANLL
jgi:MarR family transcriptional regulator, organic hydroperoxide resistance regulator